jgi:hypothetical protein
LTKKQADAMFLSFCFSPLREALDEPLADLETILTGQAHRASETASGLPPAQLK